ncbi:MAG: hypothetical protein AAGF76_01100 [Pseudomonadota bacterium]
MRQPLHQLPRRALSRPRSTARSGVAVAKELVRVEFEKQRLEREMTRLTRRLAQCEAEYTYNETQSIGCCNRLLDSNRGVS